MSLIFLTHPINKWQTKKIKIDDWCWKTVFSLLGVGWMLATVVNSQSTLNQTCLGTIIQISILKYTLLESNWVFATNSNILIHIFVQLYSVIFQIHISWSNTLCFKTKELENQSLF